MARDSKLTGKDMSVVDEADRAEQQRARKFGTVRDYSLQHRVTIAWDLNDEADRDTMFRMTVGDNEVILDAEEMMRLLRWV
jgi:hypothetical protein